MNALSCFLALPVVFMALATSVASAATDVILNGDFETFDLHHVPSSGRFPPWHFSNGFTAYYGAIGAASGVNCVFVGGSSSGGNLRQDIHTEIGQTYQLSFYERGDEWIQPQRSTSFLNVFFGQFLVGSYIRDNTIGGWNFHTFTVVAETSTTTLNFQNASQTIGSFARPGVDCVSLVAIPEPSPLQVAGSGVAIYFGACVLRRRWKLGQAGINPKVE